MGICIGHIFCFYVFQIFYKEHNPKSLRINCIYEGTEDINLLMPVKLLLETDFHLKILILERM